MKKIICALLCLVMLCACIPCLPISADTVAIPFAELEGDTVSAGATYSISNAAELERFAELCTQANGYFAGVKVILAQNITMNEGWTASATAPTGEGALTWTPISLFKGVFDGQCNTVSGIYAPAGNADSEACGLFATIGIEVAVNQSNGIDEATPRAAVKNLNITNSYFGGGKYVGAVCGLVPADYTNFNTKFENINVSSTVIEAEGDSAGGIVGRITSKSGTDGRTHAVNENYPICITNCTFDGSVTGNTTNVGGIIGKALIKVDITNCVNNGTVESTLPYTGSSMAAATVGGIIGSYTNGGSGKKVTLVIENCVNNGNVFSDTIEAYGELGGVIGYSNTPMNIVGCVNQGEVYTTLAKTNTQIGGIFGLARNSGIVIESCANVGTVSRKRAETIEDTKFSSKNYLGGIVGWSYDDCKITIKNCASYGELTVAAAKTDDNSGAVTVGGILGGSTGKNMTLTDCVFTGKINAKSCTAGGMVGLFNKSGAVLTRCISLGAAVSPSSSYNGSFLGNINNSTSMTFVDCIHRPEWRSLPTWAGFTKVTETDSATGTETEYRYMSATVKASGKDDIVKEYKFEVVTDADGKETNLKGINPAVVRNFLIGTGAQKTLNDITDPEAMKELSAFGWTNESSGWAHVKVGERYIPMPKSVSALVDAEDIPAVIENDKTESSEGLEDGEDGDGEQDAGVTLPDTFNPDLIIKQPDSDEDDETSTEAEESDSENDITESDEADGDDGDSGLGWKIAIGVTVGVAVIACIVVVAVIFVGKRNRKKE